MVYIYIIDHPIRQTQKGTTKGPMGRCMRWVGRKASRLLLGSEGPLGWDGFGILNDSQPESSKDSYFEGFWAQRPSCSRLLGYFEPPGETPRLQLAYLLWGRKSTIISTVDDDINAALP